LHFVPKILVFTAAISSYYYLRLKNQISLFSFKCFTFAFLKSTTNEIIIFLPKKAQITFVFCFNNGSHQYLF
jgi:hypothetical protein